MIRFVSGGLLFIVAALALIFQDPLLIAGAVILFLVVLITFIIGARDQRRKHKSKTAAPVSESQTKDKTLRDLGILEVREAGSQSNLASEKVPEDKGIMTEVQMSSPPIENISLVDSSLDVIGKAKPISKNEDKPNWMIEDEKSLPKSDPIGGTSGDGMSSSKEELESLGDGLDDGRFAPLVDPELSSEIDINEVSGDGAPMNGPVAETGAVSNELVRPFLESVRTASSASTLCLLRVDHSRREFRVLDVLSDSKFVRRSSRFPYDSYFLADFTGQDTLRIEVQDGSITGKDLGYYTESLPLTDLVVCPIYLDGELAAHLLADVAEGDEPFSADEFDILENSGRLLGEMLSVHGGFHIREETEARGDYIPAEPLRLVTLSSDEPYNMIIEEEVSRARKTETPLALALIHVQTEEYQKLEDDHLAEIEHLMRKDLERIEGTGRVERVGKMAFGVFIRGIVEDVEDWINQAQYHFADSSYDIPGEVIIGAACLSTIHQSSESFRVSAGQAFKEAYQTGENTILVS